MMFPNEEDTALLYTIYRELLWCRRHLLAQEAKQTGAGLYILGATEAKGADNGHNFRHDQDTMYL